MTKEENKSGEVEVIESKSSSKSNLGLRVIEASLRTKIKLYRRRAQEIEKYLIKKPDEWGRFQSEFNAEVNGIFDDIMNFEKANLANGYEDRVHKLKQIFIKKIRDIFMRGECIGWSLRKPYGYAGDFKIIDDIYQNAPTTIGFDRLFDNYFQMSAICVAVRNRKEDFKRLIMKFINDRKGDSLRIMDLACGSSREVEEIFSTHMLSTKDIIFDCYDHEKEALKFAKALVSDSKKINFIRQNVLKLACAKNVTVAIKKKYDFIYSAGLFDYFNHKISVKLIKNLKETLNPSGMLTISNVRDKYSNPSVHFMEWVGDWNLTYRTEEEFLEIFLEAGFKVDELNVQYEQQGIMQYISAVNKRE